MLHLSAQVYDLPAQIGGQELHLLVQLGHKGDLDPAALADVDLGLQRLRAGGGVLALGERSVAPGQVEHAPEMRLLKGFQGPLALPVGQDRDAERFAALRRRA